MPWFEQVMLWQDTRCMNGIMDCLERYLMYGVRKWLDWKGARGMVWVGKVSHCGKSCSNQLRIGSRE
jgi:hypothetical protein